MITIYVIDEATGARLDGSLIIIQRSPYTSDGSLYWIGWSPLKVDPKLLGRGYYTGKYADPKTGNTYAATWFIYGAPTEDYYLEIRKIGGGVDFLWDFRDAKANNLKVKANGQYMSGLSVGDVQNLILSGKKVWLIKEIPTHTLTVNSSPITGVPFTIDSASATTPYSRSLPEGTHTIVMPSTYSNYKFDHWENGSTNPTRTINLTSDMTLTAYYVLPPPPTPPTPSLFSIVSLALPIAACTIIIWLGIRQL